MVVTKWLLSCHQVSLLFQAKAIRENIGYPSYLTNKTALGMMYKGVSLLYFVLGTTSPSFWKPYIWRLACRRKTWKCTEWCMGVTIDYRWITEQVKWKEENIVIKFFVRLPVLFFFFSGDENLVRALFKFQTSLFLIISFLLSTVWNKKRQLFPEHCRILQILQLEKL